MCQLVLVEKIFRGYLLLHLFLLKDIFQYSLEHLFFVYALLILLNVFQIISYLHNLLFPLILRRRIFFILLPKLGHRVLAAESFHPIHNHILNGKILLLYNLIDFCLLLQISKKMVPLFDDASKYLLHP